MATITVANVTDCRGITRKTIPKAVPIKIISKTASPEKAIDIAVVAEGYSAKEQQKFFKDAQRLAENLLTHQPFTKYKKRINIYFPNCSKRKCAL